MFLLKCKYASALIKRRVNIVGLSEAVDKITLKRVTSSSPRNAGRAGPAYKIKTKQPIKGV